MIDKLYSDALNYIIEFLTNHEIMEFIYVNKTIYRMLDIDRLKDYMSYREHPIVFNTFDNYCFICNQGLIFLDDEINSNIIICNHL